MAFHALRVGANQIPYLADEGLRRKYESHAIHAARFMRQRLEDKQSDMQTVERLESHASELIDMVLALSIRFHDPIATSDNWTRILKEMLVAWPAVGSYLTNTISQLVFELPANQLHGMWELFLSLRASQSQSIK
jgi:hypothetical protein